MARSNKLGRRKTGTRDYRRVFVIATEGAATERLYFMCFRDQVVPAMKIISRKGDSSPSAVLKAINHEIAKRGLALSDEAWVVLDRDSWTDEQLSEIARWAEQDERYNLAVSNPQFEFWLLLHLEDGHGVQSRRECETRLRRALPSFRKNRVECDKFCPHVEIAIDRAREKDHGREDWPDKTGSTVYRLVERILSNK